MPPGRVIESEIRPQLLRALDIRLDCVPTIVPWRDYASRQRPKIVPCMPAKRGG